MDDAAFREEAKQFFKDQQGKDVDDLYEAWQIDRACKCFVKYLKQGLVRTDMNLMEALEIIEKRKFELIGIDPEAEEEDDPKDGV